MEKQDPTHPPRHSRCSFRSCRLCGLVHEGWGQAGVWAAPTAPHWIQLHDECNPGSWFQWVYAGDLVKTASERHRGHVPGYPWLRWGQEQWRPGSHESSHKAWNMTHRTLPEVNIPRGAILSGFSPSAYDPIPPASTIDQKQSEETDLGALFHKPGSRLHPWQGSDKQRAMGNSPQCPAHNNSNHTPYQGDKDTSVDQPHTPGDRHQKEKLGICSLNNTEHKHRKLHKMIIQRNML